ncbi:MAG: hypothetical protein Q8O67_12540 [Deltaproteobacteria bacterium]|nr:hypothetical protein [Deltaproteobacteria bacterium]
MTRRVGLVALVVAVLPACPFCDDVDQFLPQGSIEPAVFDLGPVTAGATCTARLVVKNGGNADLEASGGTLKDTDGSFTLKKVPTLVRLGAEEELLVDYTASDDVGNREGTNLELVTNDRDDEGVLRASVSAFVAAEPVALAASQCDKAAEDDGTTVQSPCTDLDFGAVPIGSSVDPIEARPGANLTVRVVNDGNADLIVQAAVVDGGNGDFAVIGARRGSQVFPFPVTVPAGRTGDCGEASGADNVLLIDVRFAPVNLGAAVATLNVLTTGAEGAQIDVALSGLGADTGILTNPDIVRFGSVPEGTAVTEVILVQNVGTDSASVNESCIDLEDDGTCDALCTAAAVDVTLGGTLSCEVKKSDGSHEGKGFVLEPTDARAGGGDERTVEIHWTPSAADPAIPTSAVLLLKSNIENNTVFKVGVAGGNAGILEVVSDNPCEPDECAQAVGDRADVSTWTGALELTLTNTGTATLTIEGVAPEAGTPPTIADDWTIGAPASTSLAPNASTTLSLTYANSANDASGVDGFNLIIDHNGVLGSTLVSIKVQAPPAQ